ncbi:MAG TPA: LuxR C-terminal-related transcriptional regulator [Actinoplanes sp.]|nr:LuxR C-terminal-related transcriptional regulator [Actinoplanes sp.]
MTDLAAVGIDPAHERAYRFLVRQGRGRTTTEIAAALGWTVRATRDALRALERADLVARVAGSPPTYRASPPELALETLLHRRGEELARARLLAKELQDEFRGALTGHADTGFVEVVEGREELMRYLMHLIERTEERYETLNKPPYVAGDSTVVQAVAVAISKGVGSRAVYETGMTDEETTRAVAAESAGIGEDVRTVGELPMKLALFDRRVGFVPLNTDDPRLGALVVHRSPLLDALAALFESVWLRAVPWHAGAATGELDDRSHQVLLLMSAGLKDEAIARAMGMSRRTVQKYVTDAMALLGARNRFQAALLARDRGWLEAPGRQWEIDRPV